jgi:hypothetical protein
VSIAGTFRHSPAFLKRATIGTCLLQAPPKARQTRSPRVWNPDGGLPLGPVESRRKHHYVCSGCLIDRLGSGLRPGRLHRLTLEKVSALTLVREQSLELVCQPCGRRGSYNVERLIAKHGADMRLPELLTILADCPKAQAFSIYDRCKVRFARY